jgi:hypothetical protein
MKEFKMCVLYIHVTVHRNKGLFYNQPDALIIQIYSISGIFSAHHQEFSTVRSALLGSDYQTRMKLTSAECTVENS